MYNNNDDDDDDNNNTVRVSAFLSMARRGAVSRLMLYLVKRVDVSVNTDQSVYFI